MCSIFLYIGYFDGLCLKELNGRPRQWETMESNGEEKSQLDLDYADDLSILDESVSKMNELLEFYELKVLEWV